MIWILRTPYREQGSDNGHRCYGKGFQNGVVVKLTSGCFGYYSGNIAGNADNHRCLDNNPFKCPDW